MTDTVARPERRTKRFRRSLATTITVAGLAAGTLTVGASTALAAANPYERGPAPTTATLDAAQGPFATSRTNVAFASGFGGGTIYYPTTTTAGTFGGVAIAPGLLEDQNDISWFGPRLASHGFVVFTINTVTKLDQPGSRARQLLAALDYLTSRSPVAGRVDKNRLAVMGHSMGGGGALEAARSRPTLKAAIPLAGWNLDTNYGSLKVPTLVVGAQHDIVAPVGPHSKRFYDRIPAEKAYVELRSAGHFETNRATSTVARFTISWLKRWVDNDTRYSPFVCTATTSSAISELRTTCPY